MPFDVDSTKLSVDEVRVLNAMQQLLGRLDKELNGMNEIMPDTEFIIRCDRVLDMIKDLDKDFGKEVKNWKRDVINQ